MPNDVLSTTLICLIPLIVLLLLRMTASMLSRTFSFFSGLVPSVREQRREVIRVRKSHENAPTEVITCFEFDPNAHSTLGYRKIQYESNVYSVGKWVLTKEYSSTRTARVTHPWTNPETRATISREITEKIPIIVEESMFNHELLVTVKFCESCVQKYVYDKARQRQDSILSKHEKKREKLHSSIKPKKSFELLKEAVKHFIFTNLFFLIIGYFLRPLVREFFNLYLIFWVLSILLIPIIVIAWRKFKIEKMATSINREGQTIKKITINDLASKINPESFLESRAFSIVKQIYGGGVLRPHDIDTKEEAYDRDVPYYDRKKYSHWD